MELLLKTDFGPAKAVGRSQTWPVEVLSGSSFAYCLLVWLTANNEPYT